MELICVGCRVRLREEDKLCPQCGDSRTLVASRMKMASAVFGSIIKKIMKESKLPLSAKPEARKHTLEGKPRCMCGKRIRGNIDNHNDGEHHRKWVYSQLPKR